MLSRFSLLRRDWQPLALWVCFSAGLVSAGGATVQNLEQSEQYFFDKYTAESGLPGVVVNSVCQTRDGYLWIATGGGLARFDGVRFTSFRPSNTPQMLTPLVYRICEARNGDVWIGTGRGLLRYRDHAFERIGLDDTEVHSLAEDRAGRLWIGTYGRGLFVHENGKTRHIDDEALGSARYVLQLLVDQSDRTWIGTDVSGVVYHEKGTFHRFAPQPGITGPVDAMAEQPAGAMWFGSRADGLYQWRDGVLNHFGRTEGLASESVADLQPASDGGVWIVGTTIQRISDPAHPVITTIPDTPRVPGSSLYEDSEGSIWLSAKERGLWRGGAMPYRLIATHDGLPEGVRSIAEDAAGNLWMAAQGYGLVRATPNGELTMPLNHDSSAPNPTVVLAARDGSIWVGSATALYVWKDGVDRIVPHFRGVYGLFQDRADNVWIGTANDGLFRYRDGAFATVTFDSGQPISQARSFCEDRDGAVYAAVWNQGFVRIKGDQATLTGRANGLPTDDVRAIYVDADNRVWLGFRGQGLGLWRDGKCWHSPALAQALFDHVVAIAEDQRGQLWFGTPAGVMWLDKAELLAAADGRKNVAELRIAQVTRSLRGASVWSGPQSVLCETHDRRFLFATREGILAVDPTRVPHRNLPPPVYVERVAADGRRLDGSDGIRLAAGAKNLVIDYTAVSFVEPNQVSFKYRLDGYDVDWVEAKSRRTAAYGNLAPGRYEFHVIACNADGVWNTEGATLAITQWPHFYQTGWFFGLIGIAVVGAIISANRWSHHRLKLKLERLEEKQATERERRRIAKNLHDDLGANLTEISLFAESIQRRIEAPDVNAEMVALSERVRALAGTLDAIVWSANPANDSLDRLATFVCGLFQDLCRVADLRCRIDVPEPLPPYPLTPDVRSNLFLAAREAMTNLAKHSAAKEAWLRLKMDGRVFEFVVEDDGRGFDVATAMASNRNGLGNIRSRITELHGTVAFDTAPGRGTKIVLRVPLKPQP
jgi:ligand-binding sensor domain-containing protein/signal transduction histidine kinase